MNSPAKNEVLERTLSALLYSPPLGSGGLGMQAATALMSLSRLGKLAAIGPRTTTSWPFSEPPADVLWRPVNPSGDRARFMVGNARHRQDCNFGVKALNHARALPISACYGFTQISLETATWCRE